MALRCLFTPSFNFVVDIGRTLIRHTYKGGTRRSFFERDFVALGTFCHLVSGNLLNLLRLITTFATSGIEWHLLTLKHIEHLKYQSRYEYLGETILDLANLIRGDRTVTLGCLTYLAKLVHLSRGQRMV